MRTLAAVPLATIFAFSASSSTGYEFGTNGKAIICVPSQEIFEFNRGLTRSNLFLERQRFKTDLVIVHFDAGVMKRAIPSFHVKSGYTYDASPNVISASLYFAGEKGSVLAEHGAGPDTEKIWDKTGACKQPVIVRVPRSSTYLARCTRDLNDPEHPLHILYDRQPGYGSRPSDIYSTVLAKCTHLDIGFGYHKGVELENCLREIVVGRFLIEYQFQIENAGIIPQMDAFLRSKIESWKRNCPHE